MKARITRLQEKKLLAVNISDADKDKLAELSEKADAKLIQADDNDKTVAELLGEGDALHDTGSYPAHDAKALLFAGFDRRELDRFLDALKENGIDIPLKAVYTPHNCCWSAAHLLDELIKEHKLLTGGDL